MAKRKSKAPAKAVTNSVDVTTQELVINEMTARMSDLFSQLGISHGGARDLNKVYGYDNPQFSTFFSLYKRSGVANRLVSSIPRSCWRDGATIMAGDKEALEDEINILKKRGLFQKLERADILNRIGSYSVLFIGVPDGAKANEEIGVASPEQLGDVYFTPYSEENATVATWDMDMESPRYGLPLTYELTPNTENMSDKEMTTRRSIVAHHSRVIHLAEGGLSSEIYGMPYLEPVYNRLLDLNKTIGGGAEAYFRNAVGKFALEVNEKFQGNLNEDGKKALREEVEAFTNNMQNYMRLNGMKASSLNSPHQDPQPTADTIFKELSSYSGLPIRILTGEGGGQLAGNEDKESYNAIVSDRQNQLCTNWFCGALDVLANAGMIDLPDDFTIEWPLVETLSEAQKAEVVQKRADALQKVSNAMGAMGGLAGEMTVEQAITDIMGMEYTPDPDYDEVPTPDEVDE